jgi:predicted amidohydrolase
LREFRIAAAQIASVRGDIDRNIATHAAAIGVAASHDVAGLVFPELSLTGYEPDLASELAITADDPRLKPLLALARQHRIDVVVGAPLENGLAKPALGAVVLRANGETESYGKMHLGSSERAFFASGEKPLTLSVSGQKVGIAICANSAQPSHPRTYAELGASVYAAGVFLNDEWYATDVPRLVDHARRFGMLVLMANHADSIGSYVSVGKSTAWAPGGDLLAQAEGTESALLIVTRSAAGWQSELIELPAGPHS